LHIFLIPIEQKPMNILLAIPLDFHFQARTP
jgi:hypothetical protein